MTTNETWTMLAALYVVLTYGYGLGVLYNYACDENYFPSPVVALAFFVLAPVSLPLQVLWELWHE